MTAWPSTLSHDTTEAESREAKAYRAVSTFWTGSAMSSTDPLSRDWYDDISKKTFVKLLSLVVAFAGFVGGAAVTALKDNWELREARWSDNKWEAINRIGDQAAAATAEAKAVRGLMENHDARLDRLEAKDPSGPQLARLAAQVEKLNDQLKSRGGR